MHAPVHLSPSQKFSGIRWFSLSIGCACVLLGVLVLIGWYSHLPALIQLRPGFAPMQFNTALSFVMAGGALGFCARPGGHPMTCALGSVVAAVGGLTLSEYLFHVNLGIDELLFHSYITTETSAIGRMSPVSSFCFCVTGLAFFFLGLRRAPRWRPLTVGSLASVAISISLVALLGYAFGLPGTYGWGQLTRIAIHTASGFSLLGVGLFGVAWKLGQNHGERTPRWLPVPMALSVFTGSLVLYFALDAKQDREIALTVKAGAESAKNQISVRMDARIRSLVRMARRWEYAGAPSQGAWEADAKNYVHDFPDLQALEWIDESRRVRWVIPLAGNENKLNLDLTREDRRSAAAKMAEREQQPVVTRIVNLFHGGLGFVIYVPITVEGRQQGMIAAIFEAATCLQRYLPPAVAAGEAIRISEGRQIFYERDAGNQPVREDWVATEEINLHGATWELRMWPTSQLAKRLDSPLPEVVFCAGTICSLLLGAACFFGQRSSRKATETARANAALQIALDKVKTLEGLLPICSYCKRVRDDTGYWNQIDTYLHRHTNASLSHGYCPECAAKACLDFGIPIPATIQAELDAKNFE